MVVYKGQELYTIIRHFDLNTLEFNALIAKDYFLVLVYCINSHLKNLNTLEFNPLIAKDYLLVAKLIA